jgi:hypothetical protein
MVPNLSGIWNLGGKKGHQKWSTCIEEEIKENLALSKVSHIFPYHARWYALILLILLIISNYTECHSFLC